MTVDAILALAGFGLIEHSPLVVAVLTVREGIEASRGDVESPLELFEEIDEDGEVK